jgi:hypothetical protein
MTNISYNRLQFSNNNYLKKDLHFNALFCIILKLKNIIILWKKHFILIVFTLDISIIVFLQTNINFFIENFTVL